jgi:glutathione synthase/RimK-type ligase-like ATP-grasp enzyme
MAKGHWQIYNWDAKKKDDQNGNADYLPLEDVPKIILDMAVKSAKLIGKGLFGIDIKVVDEQPMVIEINDNLNIDFGVEDVYYGDTIYTTTLEGLKSRLV